ncbi:MAG: hypothetical protein HY606_09150 [Planctomycetes bacterium]|nr:hypothetical protein [Planctomycetota bacterium]
MNVITNRRRKKTSVVQIGNSLGLILSKELVKSLKLKKGDSLEILLDSGNQILILSKNGKLTVDIDFINKVNEFTDKYKEDFKRLAM